MLKITSIDSRKVIGELIYARADDPDESFWRAAVTEWEDAAGKLMFRLWIQIYPSKEFLVSGDFRNGKALVKYIQEAAAKWRLTCPVVDTLGSLKTRTPVSVVPTCYNVGPCGRSDCIYGPGCSWLNPGVEKEREENPNKCTETEDLFLERLQNKLSNHKWEN